MSLAMSSSKLPPVVEVSWDVEEELKEEEVVEEKDCFFTVEETEEEDCWTDEDCWTEEEEDWLTVPSLAGASPPSCKDNQIVQ